MGYGNLGAAEASAVERPVFLQPLRSSLIDRMPFRDGCLLQQPIEDRVSAYAAGSVLTRDCKPDKRRMTGSAK